jgi:hypothetical protein
MNLGKRRGIYQVSEGTVISEELSKQLPWLKSAGGGMKKERHILRKRQKKEKAKNKL